MAELFGQSFGMAFVSGDAPGVTYTPQRCAEYLEYVPDAGSCGAAATVHHFGEVVEYRVALGTLGLIGLLTLLTARRWATVGGSRRPCGAVRRRRPGAGRVQPHAAGVRPSRRGRGRIGEGLVSTVLALAVTRWAILQVRRPTTVRWPATIHPPALDALVSRPASFRRTGPGTHANGAGCR
ncbi:MAG: hypothetical protein ACRDYX_04110 [Egibacteraceae bacterium]